ncbi:MAG: hypothetical protein GC164_00995 [Phycisphaera sp.]|nr:hypothetical protein [Phycisphaera sp.]
MNTPLDRSATDRRTDLRLAGRGTIEAVVEDPMGNPVQALEDTRVLNVSAGGMAVVTSTPMMAGLRVRVRPMRRSLAHIEPDWVKLEALECVTRGPDRHRLRLRLVEGAMPAQLVYDWHAADAA